MSPMRQNRMGTECSRLPGRLYRKRGPSEHQYSHCETTLATCSALVGHPWRCFKSQGSRGIGSCNVVLPSEGGRRCSHFTGFWFPFPPSSIHAAPFEREKSQLIGWSSRRGMSCGQTSSQNDVPHIYYYYYYYYYYYFYS